jgi:hypothetical protein
LHSEHAARLDRYPLEDEAAREFFFTAHQPVVPEIQSAIRIALMVDPKTLANVDQEAAEKTLGVINATGPQFNPGRFLGAVLISGGLLWAAIWTAQHNLPDISKALMNSFAGFSSLLGSLLNVFADVRNLGKGRRQSQS